MSITSHVLIVEDEPKIAQILVDFLSLDDYSTSVINNGLLVVDVIKQSPPDFVILDLMLPGKDGLTICKEIRQFSDVPILMLTARVEEIDRLMGLGFGADDYVCKPFSSREVVARVTTILRRTQQVAARPDETLSFKGIKILPALHECIVNEKPLTLTPIEFRLLTALIKSPGRVMTRDQLMTICYNDQRIVSTRTIDSHMKNLRQKLYDAAHGEDIIHSVYGVGYKV